MSTTKYLIKWIAIFITATTVAAILNPQLPLLIWAYINQDQIMELINGFI